MDIPRLIEAFGSKKDNCCIHKVGQELHLPIKSKHTAENIK